MGERLEWYPGDDAPKKHIHKPKSNKPKLRQNIQPGQVLIVLSGRFRGKRVVFLKQLESGLLLVTGPYKLNGVPLRRINQRYVIATSTKVDLKGVDSSKLNDAFFKKEKSNKKKEDKFFAADKKEKKTVSDDRKNAQKDLDKALLGNVKDAMVKRYLHARFSLSNSSAPHSMVF